MGVVAGTPRSAVARGAILMSTKRLRYSCRTDQAWRTRAHRVSVVSTTELEDHWSRLLSTVGDTPAVARRRLTVYAFSSRRRKTNGSNSRTDRPEARSHC